MNEVEQLTFDHDDLTGWYCDNFGAAAPSALQWARLAAQPDDVPITIVNFFKLHDEACYAHERGVSGQDAFGRYSSVSMPALEKVGGEFLMVSPFEASFIGEEEDWDLIAIGKYPNKQAVFQLFADDAYRKAYHHRTAACKKQRVMFARN